MGVWSTVWFRAGATRRPPSAFFASCSRSRCARPVLWSQTSCRATGPQRRRSCLGSSIDDIKALYGDVDVKVRVQRQRSSGFVGREDGYELIRGELAIGRAGHRAATLYPVGLLGPEP